MLTKKSDYFETNSNITILIKTHTNNIPYHTHNFLELVYVLDGQATHMVNGDSVTISKGDYFLIDYGVAHQYTPLSKTPFQIINCMFVPQFIDETLHNCQHFGDVAENYQVNFTYHAMKTPSKFLCHDSNGKIRKILMEMKEEFDQKQSGYQEMIRAQLILLLIHSMRKLEPTQSGYDEADVTQQIVKYIKKHYSERLSLDAITKSYNYSLSYISRIFKAETGYSFREYVKMIRIRESCRLLTCTDKKISDVAEAVGYSDVKFFTATFKELMGMSPGKYRASYK